MSSLEYIFISNDPFQIECADECSIEYIMIDLETIGKKERQKNFDTLISNHTINDIYSVRNIIKKSNLLVRCNPIHSDSKTEIDNIISAGADSIMLPMFTNTKQVESFLNIVNDRVPTILLFETPQACLRIDSIIALGGFESVHIGLNDLKIALELDFMFETLSSGFVEFITCKLKKEFIPFGFGGIARLGTGTLSSDLVLLEHKRLGSSRVILSRDFKQIFELNEQEKSKESFRNEVDKCREYWDSISLRENNCFEKNRLEVIKIVDSILKKKS
tara:strand:- start:276 stop:1100 length:825 start_codon:yes stop_codon:yes gene_type:complete